MTANPNPRIVNGHEVEIWTRKTLADGSQMYSGCINPICDAIEDAGSDISGLSGAISAEVERATNAENDLSAAINVETTRATGAEYDLDQKINTEIQDRISAISAETSARENADNVLSSAITAEENRAKNVEGALSAAITAETARAFSAETVLQTNINNEATARNDADQKLQQQIDTLEAATDVIDVFGTYSQFNTEWKTKYFPTGKKPTITDNDIIKIINDEHTPVGDTGNLTTGHQTYYQWTWTATTHTTTADGDWNFIGFTEPYYNTAEIDSIISDTKTELSSMVSNNYLSAKGAVLTGRNIAITEDANSPKITIATKDDVDFDTVSAATAYGSSAKFDNISASGISSNSAIINTISGHSAHFDDIDISAIDLDNITAKNIIAENISATSAFSGKDLTISNSAKIVGISSTNISSTNISSTNVSSKNISALSLTANTASGQSANFDDISGKNISANIISGTNIDGDKLTVNTSAKIVGISATNVSSTNITANSLTANTATGNSAKFTDISSTNITGINLSSTNISAKNISGLENITAKSGYFTDISATNNISAESATIVNVSADILSASNIHSNISSFFRDVRATNLTADFGRIPNFSTDEITAESSISSNTISADNITGTNAKITNITGESGYFTDLRGETLHGVTSSIVVDELISAVSSMSGESNLYVIKDELECEIGTDNSATNQSFAQGKSNSARENSFVQGNLNSANENSFAQGYWNSANTRSFAQGYYNTAYYESLAQGQTNRVSNYSMGQGQGNSATNYSIAQGNHNDASNTAQAFGSNLVIESAMAIGKFNKTSSDAVFVIGNGTADNARNDLMVVDNSAAITLINYPYNDNQVDKIIISTTGVSGMYDHSHGGIASTGEYSSEWSNLCNIDNKYVPLSAQKCVIGSNNTASDNDLVFIQGMSNYAYDNSLAQGTNNSAITNSLAQGHHNSAESYSIAVGMNNTAYLQSQAFGKNAFASAGMAINPSIWGSNNPTCAFANGFAMGKDCLASGNSFAFGYETSANVFSMAFGQNNTASNFSLAFGLGITANDNQYIYGKYPSVGSNTVFAIGNGTADNDRSNYVSINKYGTLNLKNVVNNVNKSVIIHGHDGYIRSEEKHRNIPFLLTSAFSLSNTIADATLLETPNILSETLLLNGQDSWYLSLWIPTGTSANSFRLIKSQSYGAGTYTMTVGVQSGYTMIFKNFASGSTGISARQIKENVETKTSWPVGQAGTEIDRTLNSIYYPATNKNTCFLFKQIPSNDTIDVIVDSFSKQFIMIKNHSST